MVFDVVDCFFEFVIVVDSGVMFVDGLYKFFWIYIGDIFFCVFDLVDIWYNKFVGFCKVFCEFCE